MNADRTVTADAMWARIENMLPGKASDPGGTAADNRLFMEAVLWRFRRRAAGIGLLARQHVLDPRPHGVGQNRPVCIHDVTCFLPVPPFRRSSGKEMAWKRAIRKATVNGP